MMLRQLVISIWLLLTFTVLTHQVDNSNLRSYLVNSKGLDYKFTGKADSHRFGVELKENKQFHHTITAEDGVRLGCYGFELEGKKYSTNYIADGKGYRLAPTDTDLITVFAKGSSEPRIASFIESFNEEEIKAANIRYLFPDGCQAPTIIYDPNNPSSSFENRRKLFESLIEKAKKDNENNVVDRSVASRALKASENADDRNKNGNNNLNSSNATANSLQNGNHNSHNKNNNNNNNINNHNSLNGRNDNHSLRNPNGYIYEANKNVRGSNFDCCNIDNIQLILPSNDSCSQNTAKLVIPISSTKLSTIPVSDFASIQLSSSISFVLKELQYLVDKYNL